MPLNMNSRPVGDVVVIQCTGRIVAGGEVFSLQSHVGDALHKQRDVILQVEQVEFVDSSGLGALVRLASMAREKGGDLKLCGLHERVRKTMEMTHMLGLFETYDSEAEAIMAAYLGSRYSKDKSGKEQFRVLCVHDSVLVCTFLKEVLCHAGYNVLTIGNVDDARILLKATKAKLVILGPNLQTIRGKPSTKAFEEIDPSVSFILLDKEFDRQDPGESANQLLENIRNSALGQILS